MSINEEDTRDENIRCLSSSLFRHDEDVTFPSLTMSSCLVNVVCVVCLSHQSLFICCFVISNKLLVLVVCTLFCDSNRYIITLGWYLSITSMFLVYMSYVVYKWHKGREMIQVDIEVSRWWLVGETHNQKRKEERRNNVRVCDTHTPKKNIMTQNAGVCLFLQGVYLLLPSWANYGLNRSIRIIIP